MTKREVVSIIKQAGVNPFKVSAAAVSAYRVEYYEKTGHTIPFVQAVKEMYGPDSRKCGKWLRQDMKMECRV